MVDDVELAASADGDHRADLEVGGEKAELNIHRFRCQLSAQFLYLKLRLREELALRRLYKSRILPNGTMTSRTGIISLGRFLEFHSCGKRK